MNALIKVLLFFIMTQLLGVYTGIFILSDAMDNPLVGDFMSMGEGVSSLPLFILYVLLGAVIFLVLIRLNIALLFTILEFAVISVTSSILFYAFMRPFIPDPFTAMALAAVAGMALALAKHFIHRLKNVAAIFSSAGAGAVFGFSFSFFASLVIFFIMAIYDYIAVFRTKHMVSMAKEIMKQDMSFTVTATEKSASGKESRLDLGTGDLALPVMVEVAAYPIHPLLSLVTLIGATAGVSFVLVYAWKKKVFLPAIPFIFTGMMISLLAAFALTILKLL